jgi:hypothetical protein
MTMNGIPIVITDVKVLTLLLSTLTKLSKYHAEIIIEAHYEIRKAFHMYFEGTECSPTDEPLEILQKVQSAHIQVKNKLFANKPRIKDLLQESVSKMIHNHAEAVSMAESIKLNIAMLEKAKCILTGSNDKETINSLIDYMWGLVNKSRLQPTHKQDMTSVNNKLNRNSDIGRYLELENVLN